MNAADIVKELSERGLTQLEIQRRSGVHQSTVSAIKTGRRGTNIRHDIHMKLQTLLDEVRAESKSTTDDAQPPAGGSVSKTKEYPEG
ncbi:helix-turn-helix domain-containing protein [Burkholderia ubonensis]|uniref:helix-turn-helix domain-containing protein n=1 Tax=Burkholderia ubonensis TaxID=101571 RepID=UPI000A7E64D1|nr:helix-turn-helix transcriptional regulator [Burkholderia ubonensis]